MAKSKRLNLEFTIEAAAVFDSYVRDSGALSKIHAANEAIYIYGLIIKTKNAGGKSFAFPPGQKYNLWDEILILREEFGQEPTLKIIDYLPYNNAPKKPGA